MPIGIITPTTYHGIYCLAFRRFSRSPGREANTLFLGRRATLSWRRSEQAFHISRAAHTRFSMLFSARQMKVKVSFIADCSTPPRRHFRARHDRTDAEPRRSLRFRRQPLRGQQHYFFREYFTRDALHRRRCIFYFVHARYVEYSPRR